MKKILFGFLIAPLLAGEIKLTEIKPVVDEIIAYHVDENIFSSKLAKRSFKNYLTTFDPEYRYLLASEVDEILQKDPSFWQEVAQKYQSADFSPYQILNTNISKAILRSRKIFKQIKTSLLSKNEFKKNEILSASFCKSEVELAALIEDEMEGRFYAYARDHDISKLSEGEKLKIFEFYEKKKLEHEELYLSSKNISIRVLKAIAASLDGHTAYYSEEEAYALRMSLRKEFCGLGIQLKESVEGPFISYIVPKSPAEATGLMKVGDIIKEIDGQSTDKINFSEMLYKLVGNPHSTVSLVAEDKNGHKTFVELSREKIRLDEERISFDYEHFGDGIIGLIRLPSFYDNSEHVNAEEDLRHALSELKSVAPLMGLIIDMRENSGGFLQQAVQCAGLFLQKGTVALAKYANDEVRFTRDLDPKLFYQGPIVILISKASASAAEVFSQALQDEGVAIVVGDKRSFGKGSMQYQTITDANSKHFYKVTVGRYFTSKGKSPQLNGVESDIVVPTVYSALQIGEKYLRYPLSIESLDGKNDVEKYLKAILASYLTTTPTTWQKMNKILIQNSALRAENDHNLQLFYKQLLDENIPFKAKTAGCGSEDLQKREAINIMKDMIFISKKQ